MDDKGVWTFAITSSYNIGNASELGGSKRVNRWGKVAGRLIVIHLSATAMLGACCFTLGVV